jgi:colanic acid biosynthesis glycosyl transferase WcaI
MARQPREKAQPWQTVAVSAAPDPTGLPLVGVSLCVVGMSYAPEPAGIALYTTGLAEMLVEHGARVEVVTGVPHYPAWRVEPTYRWRMRADEHRHGVSVRRARHFVPAHQSVLSRLAWEASFLANGALVRLNDRPDGVIAVTPSLSGALVGARAARAAEAPLAVLVQDLVGQAARQSGIAGGNRVASAAKAVEGRVLRRADRVLLISDTFRRQVLEYGVSGDRVRLLPNWSHISPARAERAQVRREMGWNDDVFVVLHTGNMGLKQGLQNVVEAARSLAGRRDVLLVLMGDGNRRAALQQAGRGVDVLRFLGPVHSERYPDVLAAADLLLVNELPTVGEMSLPSKLTSYFASGQPVLAAVSADGACARELEASEGGVRVEPADPEALARAIVALRHKPQERVVLGLAGARYAERTLSRNAASAQVLRLAQDLLSSRSTSKPSGA